MVHNGTSGDDGKRRQMGPHEGFLELCAVSTTGELTEQEQQRLQDHLATCAECRQAAQEFGTVADTGIPLLSSALSGFPASEWELASDKTAETQPIAQIEDARTRSIPVERRKGLIFTHRNGHGRAQMNWNYVWMSLAAAVVLAIALGIYSYQFGKHEAQGSVQTATYVPDTRVDVLEQQISDVGHERELLKARLAQRDETIAGLRRQIAEQSRDFADVKSAQASLDRSLQNDQVEKQQVAHERSSLSQKLEVAEASLQKLQIEVGSLRQQRSQDQYRAEGLEAQIRDLHSQIREQEQAMSKQEDLLAHDRDIRDLMGARDLYIAEVYDVARDGSTQKPYGRVFYTRGKSLIFYAYDLDKQPGVKNASTFQAWGRSGPDNQQVSNLGVFYQDSAAKKRWVLKFGDPRTLEQIQAVFVTVEPNGGSHKPSGKPLLFASLKIEPNHP
jgi:hypothetical protein